MSAAKIAVTIDKTLLARLDRMVGAGRFPRRSRAVQEAIREKLDPKSEQQLADEGLSEDFNEWPAY
jgi:metal-responsive CopG/Arc/MetJ family transcriptional regulator